MTEPKEPLTETFTMQSDIPEIARLGILIEVFDQMEKSEAIRTLRYLKDRYVAHRAKGDASQ